MVLMRSLILVALGQVVAALPCWADRGSIPYQPELVIFEPMQRAMIAFDGKEQILILSTDLKSSAPTKVLEVLPLPSPPKVSRADADIFIKANIMIELKREQEMMADAKSQGKGFQVAAKGRKPGGKVQLHKKIGAHDITVTKVLNRKSFVRWVNNYLKKDGVENPQIPKAMIPVIDDYIKDGYQWFAFDVVDLNEQLQTNDAVKFQFKTDHLYYPLRITRVEQGQTDIRLLVFTPKVMKHITGIPKDNINFEGKPVTLTGKEVEALDRSIFQLMGRPEEMKLRTWQLTGDLAGFENDLVARF